MEVLNLPSTRGADLEGFENAGLGGDLEGFENLQGPEGAGCDLEGFQNLQGQEGGRPSRSEGDKVGEVEKSKKV